MIFRLPVLLACALALGAPARAQPAVAEQAAAEITEQLLISPPSGWKEGGTTRGRTAITSHFFPADQNAEKWNQMLSIQVIADPRADGRRHLQQVVETSRAACEASGPSAVKEASVNGYPSLSMTITCTKGRQSGLGGLVAIKTIRGAQALYVVERIWRGQPFAVNATPPAPPEMLQEWQGYMRAVNLCDSADPQRHPCPK